MNTPPSSLVSSTTLNDSNEAAVIIRELLESKDPERIASFCNTLSTFDTASQKTLLRTLLESGDFQTLFKCFDSLNYWHQLFLYRELRMEKSLFTDKPNHEGLFEGFRKTSEQMSPEALKEAQLTLISAKNTCLTRMFFEELPRFTISDVEDSVLAKGNTTEIYCLLNHVPGADLSKAQAATIASGDPAAMAEFIMDFEDCDKSAVFKALVATGDTAEILEVASEVDKEVVHCELIKLGDAIVIIDYINDVPDVDVLRLQRAVIEKCHPRDITTFTHMVFGADVALSQSAIIATGDPLEMLSFANTVERADIKVLQDAVNATRNIEIMVLFQSKISGASVLSWVELLQKENDPEWVAQFKTAIAEKLGAETMDTVEKLRNAVEEEANAFFETDGTDIVS